MTADTFHDHDHNHYHSHASSPASLVSRLSVLLPLLGEHWKLIAIAYLTGTLHQVLALASAGVGAFVIAKAAFGTPIAELSGWIVLLIALILPYGLTRVADSPLTHLAAFRALAEIRGKIYLAFERLAPGYLLERRSGDLGAAAISDVEQVELFFAHTLSQLAVAATVPIATTILLASFHWSLAVALLPVLLVLALVPAWLRRHSDLQGRELRETLGQMSSDSTDTLQGLRLTDRIAGHTGVSGLGGKVPPKIQAQIADLPDVASRRFVVLDYGVVVPGPRAVEATKQFAADFAPA